MTTVYRRSRPTERSYLLGVVIIAGALLLGSWLLASSTDRPARTSASAALPSEVASPDADQRDDVLESRPVAPVETSKVFASKDPFESLVEVHESDEAVNDAGVRKSMAAGTDEADRGSRSPESPNKSDDGTSVKIVDVAEDATVDVDIDGRIFHVTKGDRFARNFRLLFTKHTCVSMLFGDDQFSICEGEEALK